MTSAPTRKASRTAASGTAMQLPDAPRHRQALFADRKTSCGVAGIDPGPLAGACLVFERLGHQAASVRCCRLQIARPVAISRPTVSRSAVRASSIATSSPRYITADPVGQLEHLVELGRDEQDGRSLVALGDHLAVDELDAADVQAARRLVEHQHAQLAAELARHDGLLLVAAGQGAARDGCADGRPDVVLRDGLVGPARRTARSLRTMPRAIWRLVVLRQDQVVLDREAEHEPEAVAVAGHERHARLLQLARAQSR